MRMNNNYNIYNLSLIFKLEFRHKRLDEYFLKAVSFYFVDPSIRSKRNREIFGIMSELENKSNLWRMI
jgi:hypothetical protein